MAQDLELSKRRTILTRERFYTIIAGVAIILLVAITYTIINFNRTLDEVRLTAREARDASRLSSEFYEKEVIPGARLLLDKGIGMMDNGLRASEEFRLAAGDVRASYLPQAFGNVNAGITDLRGVLNSGRALLDTAAGQVDANGKLLQANQVKAGETLEVTRDGLREVLAQAALAGKDVRLVTSDPALQDLPEELNAFARSLNRSAGKIEVVGDNTIASSHNLSVVTNNAARLSGDVADRANRLLKPAPAPWYRRYLLTPLKEAGGITYLFVRIANGL